MVQEINSLSRTLALFRQRLADAQAANKQAPAKGTTAAAPDPHAPAAALQSQVELMHKRINAVPADDPQRKRKVLRIFIEAVLLDQFGEAHILSPDLTDLVDRSLAAIESDSSLGQVVDQAVADLTR